MLDHQIELVKEKKSELASAEEDLGLENLERRLAEKGCAQTSIEPDTRAREGTAVAVCDDAVCGTKDKEEEFVQPASEANCELQTRDGARADRCTE